MTKRLAEIVAANIKNARSALGLSQAALAERAQLSTGHLAMIELCNRVPSIDSLEALSQALGIETYELLMPAPLRDGEHTVSAIYSKSVAINKDIADIFRKYLPSLESNGD
jgi:transcriptional regulator with XRE-family HTH domain